MRQRSTIGLMLVVLAGGLTLQTWRLSDTATELARARTRATSDGVKLAAFKENVLRSVRSDIASGAPLPALDSKGHTIVMVVDTRCAACERALMALRTTATVDVRVVSFVDSPAEVTAWLRERGLGAFPVDEAARASALEALPRGITPLFLEFAGGEPVDVHVGQPKEYWVSEVSGWAGSVGEGGDVTRAADYETKGG